MKRIKLLMRVSLVAICLFIGPHVYSQTRNYYYLPGADSYYSSISAYQDGGNINNIGLSFQLEEGGLAGASVKRYINMSRGGSLGIGIGNVSPGFKLHVSADDEYQIGIRLDKGKLSLGGYSEFVVDAYGITGGRFKISSDGQVTIGNISPGGCKLAVDGKIGAREVVVTLVSPFPDYVFENSYTLRPLSQVESFIKQNKHLPEVPSAIEVEKNGINLGEMDALLLKKIEELTLYMIQQKKEIEEVKNENKDLKELNQTLENRIQKLEN